MKYLLLCCLLCLSTIAFAAQDSDLIRAKALVKQVENGLKHIKRNDVNTINKLTDKLKNAKDLLTSTGSKDDPVFAETVEKWKGARTTLLATFEEWKQPEAQAQKPSGLSGQALYNSLIAKYQKNNRPVLGDNPTPEQAEAWATAMLSLIKEQRMADQQTVNQAYSEGRLSKAEYDRFDHWVNTMWFNQIIEQFQQAYAQTEGRIATATATAMQVLYVQPNDMTGVVNITNKTHQDAGQVLAMGLQSVEVAATFDRISQIDNSATRTQQREQFTNAIAHYDALLAKLPEHQNALSKIPKTVKKLNPESLHMFVNGNKFCEITKKGEVWFGGTSGGWVEDDGDIYLKSDFIGSFEEDGQVWSYGKTLGSLEENGDVWVRGRKVATFKTNGDIIMGGSDSGRLEGNGDWRKAAVVYFFGIYDGVQKY
ncbi:MAG: hypothetical protein CL589_10700 [Alteromonadaceae bacterium]|nr:hypothetical protein [Alteromonadaceae bacterium]MAX43083.1 hypothetical protein [Alteromonadaceae bacterium]|tara:strand:+ start:58378 stop:59652 length:1275 start_codon:yes stop_codon:yes gene_type:complete